MPPAAVPVRKPRVLDIRTGDQVLVLTGKDAGKKGTVTKVLVNSQGWKKSTGKFGAGWQRTSPLAGAAVVVDGVNIAKRHTKPRSSAGRTDRQPRVQQGGILDLAMPLNISNVMVICPSCKRPTRIRHAEAADGRSVRACAHCGEPLTRVEKKRK
jgi:large subunit ribosomal protein L24